MAYCTNCGNEITGNVKFCPHCGTKVETVQRKTERRPSPKRKMQKGVVKSLEKEITDTVTSKIENTISGKSPEENTIHKTSPEITDYKTTSVPRKTPQKTIILYLLLSILLLILGPQTDEITGVLYFSIFILVAYAIRHKKEKPFNGFLKIILSLQLILMFSVFMSQIDLFLQNFISFFEGLTLLGLFIVNLFLLFKGNKN